MVLDRDKVIQMWRISPLEVVKHVCLVRSFSKYERCKVLSKDVKSSLLLYLTSTKVFIDFEEERHSVRHPRSDTAVVSRDAWQECGRCVDRMDHHCPWIDNCRKLRHFSFTA